MNSFIRATAMLLFLCATLICAPSTQAVANEYTLALLAKDVSGNGTVQFTVAITNTSNVDLALSECDLMFDLGIAEACEDANVTVRLATAFESYYDVTIPEFNPVNGRVGVEIFPTVDTENMVWLESGEQIDVADITIGTTCKQLFPADVSWSTDGFIQTVVYARARNVANEFRVHILDYAVETQQGGSSTLTQWQCNPTPTSSTFYLSTEYRDYFWQQVDLVFFDMQGTELAVLKRIEINGIGHTQEMELPSSVRVTGTYIITVRDASGNDVGTAKCVVVR